MDPVPAAKNIRHVLISLAVIMIATVSYSQNYRIKNYTTDNGLPHNNVRAIAIDSTGFMWFGTWDGLSRFDGYSFKNYYHVPGDSTSLQYISVSSLRVDGSNNLWVLSGTSYLSLFNSLDGTFIQMAIPGNQKNKLVFAIEVDKKGDLWILCNDSVFIRDHQNGQIGTFRIIKKDNKPDFTPIGMQIISLEDDGSIWAFGNNIFKFEKDTIANGEICFRLSDTYPINARLYDARYTFDRSFQWKLITSESGEKYILSNTGLYKFNELTKSFDRFTGKFPLGSFRDGTCGTWFDEKSGITVFNKPTLDTTVIRLEENSIVEHLFMQKSGLIWFSAINRSGVPGGLSIAVPTASYFRNYIENDKQSQIPAVFPITEDKYGNMLAGIRGVGDILRIYPDGKKDALGKIPPVITESGGHIRALVSVPGGIWIGYLMNVLLFYDYKSGTYTQHFAGEFSYRTMIADKNGKLYIGTNRLTVYDPESRESRILWTQDGYSNFYKLYFDSNGILWGGLGSSILLRYDPATGSSKTYTIMPGEAYHIEDICSSDSGKLWLAFLGAGICEYDPGSGKKTFYSTANGLSNNTTYSILKDKNGNLWISTNNGISMLNTKTGVIRNFDRNDGLDITEFNSDAAYISDKGEFFLGGMGGFVGFKPDAITSNNTFTKQSRILLSDLRVSGSSKKLKSPLNSTDTIILERGENNFHIFFSSTDYVNADKTKFRYRLRDISNDWTITDHRTRDINYSNLNPGIYRFDIEATNSVGDWSVAKSLVIKIKPFFYQTRIFFIIIGTILFGLIHLIVSLYLRQFRNKERLVTDQLRLSALRGQMNPHFIFNSLNSINYFISNNDKLSANRYIADFSRLIRRILSNMGNDYVSFSEEINSIRDYLQIEHLRFGDKFEYYIDTSGVNSNESLMVTPGLIQPFIENAIWHGVRSLEKRKGKINLILLSEAAESIKCFIEDDGIGRKLSGEMRSHFENHESKGIAIVSERLQIISKIRGRNYNLKISDLYPEKKEPGTRIEIDIPAK